MNEVSIDENTHTSMGSTSCAMITSWAFFCSTSVVMWLMPYLMVMGFFPGVTSPPSLFFCAMALSRSRFWIFVSGRYLCSSLKSCVAGDRSVVQFSWASSEDLSNWHIRELKNNLPPYLKSTLSRLLAHSLPLSLSLSLSLHTCLFVEGLSELVDGWRDFQTLIEDLPLSLQANVLGPLHKTSQISLWLDVTTCTRELHIPATSPVNDSYRFQNFGVSSQWAGSPPSSVAASLRTAQRRPFWSVWPSVWAAAGQSRTYHDKTRKRQSIFN